MSIIKIEDDVPIPKRKGKYQDPSILKVIPLGDLKKGQSFFLSEEDFDTLLNDGFHKPITHPILSMRNLIARLSENYFNSMGGYSETFLTRTFGYEYFDGEPSPKKGTTTSTRGLRIWRR